ncbi:MAG: hypothetical protein QOD06_804, partial [Candidatus Binatota bacterium]|nr:hypothetical protein [Candidatus Binatota bacterium]
MTPGARGWLSDSGPEPELTWMVVASTAVHVAAFAVLAFLPREIFSGTPPAVVAYTVKIVDPNALGGRLPQGPIRPDRAPAAARDGARDESKPPAEKKPPPKQEPARPPEEKAVTIPAPPKAEKAAEAKKIAAAKEAEAKALAVKAAIDAKAAAAKAAADAKAAAAKAAADARAAAEARARAEAERAERKQHAEQVASLARDRRIQDAVGKLGRRGTADEA